MKNKEEKSIVPGFKGFDKDLKCRDMQYEIGKEFTFNGNPVPCNQGLHFCENPIDVLGYYQPGTSRFAQVEGHDVNVSHDQDSKIATNRLFVKAEISLHALLGFAVKFILDKVDFKNAPATNTGYQSAATNTGYQSAATNTGYQSAATNTGDQSAATNTGTKSAATNTGYQSAATNTGDQSAATNTGYQSAATNTGYQSAATVEGAESVAISVGIEGRAKGKKGCWLVCSEWKQDKNTFSWSRIDVQSAFVDGKEIKEDVFYVLSKGKFKIAE